MGLQCLSAGGTIRTFQRDAGVRVSDDVSSAFRLGGLYGRAAFAADKRKAALVSSAFRLGGLYGLQTCISDVSNSAARLQCLSAGGTIRTILFSVKHTKNGKSPVPFGWGDYTDRGNLSTSEEGSIGLQCLSAGGTIRTGMVP